ncbi:ribosome recycling factor domain-containing protein [Chytriomyces sp. MP71]|nr:ribosome recycling factor domain-containing protein [Chytriomyces sp. MP71]
MSFTVRALRVALAPYLMAPSSTFFATRTIINPALHTGPQCRFYAAKKKDAKGSKGGKAKSAEDDDAPPPEFDLSKTQSKMRLCVERLRAALSTSVTVGRANPALLDKVIVTEGAGKKGAGQGVPLASIAQISTKDAHTLMVVLNDEDFTGFAEKGIRDANLGLAPIRVNASTLKVTLPRMSAEYRDTIMKTISQASEKHRTQIRDLRADARLELKKLKIKSSDEVKRIETKIQAEHDAFMKELDAAVEAKKKEVAVN